MQTIYTIQTAPKSQSPDYIDATVNVDKEAKTVVAQVTEALASLVLYVWHKPLRSTRYDRQADGTYSNRFGFTLTFKIVAPTRTIADAFVTACDDALVSNEFFDGEDEIAQATFLSMYDRFPGATGNLSFMDGSEVNMFGCAVVAQ